MKSLRWGTVLFALAIVVGALTTACHPTFVVVPRPEGGYSATDTLRGYRNGDEVRVTFRYDTVMRVDTVTRVDSLWLEGTRTVVRFDTVIRVDTVRVPAPKRPPWMDTVAGIDTVHVVRTETVVRVDTVRIPTTRTVVRVDTVVRLDTVVRVDTIRIPTTRTVVRVDTVVRLDTVLRVDTIRVAGQRLLFVPPGHYPPAGQCRVWVHGVPPGQQARAAACDALGEIPAGAFILFGGEAWDFDYDWIAASLERPGAVPPEIIALQRGGARPGG